ncbi:MAG: 5-(carboxyamino)imidazole ribonucleotide synthase [Planctomycetota bacterium]
MPAIIGVVGGGQLGRMLATAGVPLGLRFRFWDPSPTCPASAVGEVVVAPLDDLAAVERFTDGLGAATYEFENIPVETVRRVAEHVSTDPPVRALEVSQERLAEKRFLESLGIPVARFASAGTRAELDSAADHAGFPLVLKTRRFGYDGKGQVIVNGPDELDAAWHTLGAAPAIAEQLVAFDRELSLVAARARDGSFQAYPLVQNTHEGGILRATVAPAPGVSPQVQDAAEHHARAIMDELGYVGVVTIEYFEAGGSLIANEIAPRVHNSGHWTIEGAVTSQFAQHLRAIAGLPLGDPAPRAHAAMINLIGAAPPVDDLASIPGAHPHLYSKSPRPGRKLGHVTVVADSAEALAGRVAAAERTIFGGSGTTSGP